MNITRREFIKFNSATIASIFLEPVFGVGYPVRVVGENGVVVEYPVEEYLRHVVPAEIGANWPPDAIVALTIAARSYTYFAMGHPRHLEKNAHLCTTAHCQAFAVPNRVMDKAIEMTAGLVLTYENRVIDAVYSLRCGSHTRSNEDGFGGEPLPYLRGVPCFCHGKRKGHGVGLCVEGMAEMAKLGYSVPQILFYYYSLEQRGQNA